MSISPALLDPVAHRFRVLGDPTRLAILQELLTREEASVSELVEALGLGQANASKHLRQLLDAGIVSRRQEGTSAYYRVADDSIRQLCDIVCDAVIRRAEATAALLSSAR